MIMKNHNAVDLSEGLFAGNMTLDVKVRDSEHAVLVKNEIVTALREEADERGLLHIALWDLLDVIVPDRMEDGSMGYVVANGLYSANVITVIVTEATNSGTLEYLDELMTRKTLADTDLANLQCVVRVNVHE